MTNPQTGFWNIVQPVTLTGTIVRLEPLSETHAPALASAGAYEEIWRHMVYGTILNQAQMLELIKTLLERQAQGSDLPFAVIHLDTGKAIGSTRYLEINPEHRNLEIGGTWYTPVFQRTAVNTECKYLLLKHAFEYYGCLRVQFKTDLRNVRSQRALERIGAIKEGVIRKHLILPDGFVRDSVYYSILDNEWPEVKVDLEKKLRNRGE